MEPEFSRQILDKYTNINFHETPSSGRPVAPRERTYGPTDMTNLAVILSLICERN